MPAFRNTIAMCSAIVAFGVAATSAFAVGETASATLKVVDGSDAGVVTFTEAAAGVLIKFDLKGLPPGPHAVHIHERGICEADFTGTRGIFNPLGAQHGFLNEEGPMAGDLPNINVGQDGTVVAEVLSPFLALGKDVEDGLFDADGSAVVLFEKADDYLSDPEGGAGARIACGVLKPK